jgi:hypothetical protein
VKATLLAILSALSGGLLLPGAAEEGLEPRGEIHIPIGVPDTLDSLKTFVEAEGNFSPGFASHGVAFWIYEPKSRRYFAPTQDDVPHTRGLGSVGALIPWTRWKAGNIDVRTEVCQAARETPKGDAQVVGTRVTVTNRGELAAKCTLYVAITPIGAAGGPLHELRIENDTVFANDAPVLIPNTRPTGAEAPAPNGNVPPPPIRNAPRHGSLRSRVGDASGALRYDVALAAGASKTFGFVCPVLHGRRAVRHEWDGVSTWAQLDDADPIRGRDGVEQPAPGAAFYRLISADSLFSDAEEQWRKFRGDVEIDVPDARWSEAFRALTAHAAMCMNEGAPDVAVINYNVFNRDGVYVANILQKAGNFALAQRAIDYFLEHPFNGRVQPEADNPGQVLWILGEHWRFTRDRDWLARVWASVRKLAAMIHYCRTTPEPHWVSMDGIGFGNDLAGNRRLRLKPGACDGFHPEYTEAFDIAGMRSAADLAEAKGDAESAAQWRTLAGQLRDVYDGAFGADLRRHEYANYCVLWPCAIYSYREGRGFEAFRELKAQEPTSWRYFPLGRAHQGLLAGSREAAAGTLAQHMEIESMRGWYALDEGGPSGPGNWGKARTHWKVRRHGPGGVESAAAMPHGWAIAEMQLLLRDALAFEDGDRLVLFGGVPVDWFGKRMELRNLPTHFGSLSVKLEPAEAGKARVTLSGKAQPPGGIIVRTPRGDVKIEDSAKGSLIDL